jgi:hypothetical protein
MDVRAIAGMLVTAAVLSQATCVGGLPSDSSTGSGGTAGSANAVGSGGTSGSAAATGTGASTGVAGAFGGRGAATGVGATAGTAGAPGGGAQPPRLVIFYTRWGTSYPDWWPTGSDRSFTLGPILAPLEPYKDKLIILSGLTNANVGTDAAGSAMLVPAAASEGGQDAAMMTLLTASSVVSGGSPHGPSFDTAVGDCGGTAGPPLRLAIGQFGYDDIPGVSFDATGGALRGEHDPNVAAATLLGHLAAPLDPNAPIDTNYPQIGAAQMDVAVEALARSKTCVVTLMWGDDFVPRFLGLTLRVHELSHTAADLYSATHLSGANPAPTAFSKLQTFYAQQFAALLDRMSKVPVGAGTLLDQSVVIWISETGAGPDHLGRYIPVVIAGSGGGHLDVGRFIEIKAHAAPPAQFIDIDTIVRTQGDLLAALAVLWRAPTLGDFQITRQPLIEILKLGP